MTIFLEVFISCLLLFLGLYWIDDINIPIKKYIIPFLFLYILSFVFNFINPSFAIASFWISGGVFLYINYKSLRKTIFNISTITIFNIFSIYIVEFILINVLGKEDFKNFTLSFNNRLIMYFFCGILIFIFCTILKTLLHKTISSYKENKYFIYIANLILVSTTLLIYFNMTFNRYIVYTDSFFKYLLFILVFIFSALIASLMIIVAFINTNDKKLKEQELESLTQYTNSLEELYLDMRKFRHDYINIISSLAGFIDDENLFELKKYFSEQISPISTIFEKNNFRIGLLQNLKIPEIKGLMSIKLLLAQEKNIDVFLDISEPIDSINMNKIDLTRVLGIFIDNAIEACSDIDCSQIKVSFVKRKSSIVIIIINSINNKPNLHDLFKKGFSTKGNNRGLGLYSVKELLDKTPNITLETEIEENNFIQILTIND